MNEIRSKGGKKAAKVAITANCFLTFFNILIGLLSGSYALVSEGAHTLSDVITSVIAYIGFHIGQKPADKEHPMGHGRSESISGLIIVIFLAMVSYEIISEALKKIIFHQEITTPSYLAIVMAIIGIIVNYGVSRYIINIGKEINSPAIIADGEHQKTDIFSSLAILLGVLAANCGFPIADPIIGLIIGCLILKTAYEIGKDNVNNIMGAIPSQELIKEVENAANSVPNVSKAHNIKIDYQGAYATVTLHIELDGNMNLYESHKIVHEVQRTIVEKVDVIKYASVHACPIGLEYDHLQELDK